MAIIGNCDYALMAWPVQFIDITVSTVLFASWPVFFVLLTAMLVRKNGRNGRSGKITGALLLLMVVGFFGLAFVIAGQTGGFAKFDDSISLHLVAGVVIALGAMILSSLKTFGIDWGADLVNKLSENGQEPGNSLVFCFVLVAFLISSLGSAVVCVAVGLSGGETLEPESLGLAFIAGMILNTIAGVMWRRANLPSGNFGGNALSCSIPVFALLWLFVSRQADVARVDYLLIGTVLIVTANLLINAKSEVRRGFRVTVLALGFFGAFVYLRDGMFTAIGVTQWHWPGDGYYGSVGLAATMFTLLLAFRVARLFSRASEEANLTFGVFRKMDSLVRRGVISGDVLDCVLRIDEAKHMASLNDAYTEARSHIIEANLLDDADRETLTQAETDLDALTRSKQGGLVLGEIFALIIFATITIVMTLSTRPETVKGWSLLLVELFAMLTPAVIIFLMVYVIDLDRERDERKLKQAENGDYLLQFPEIEPRLVDRWLSVIVGIAIVATYAGLLAHKSLG